MKENQLITFQTDDPLRLSTAKRAWISTAWPKRNSLALGAPLPSRYGGADAAVIDHEIVSLRRSACSTDGAIRWKQILHRSWSEESIFEGITVPLAILMNQQHLVAI